MMIMPRTYHYAQSSNIRSLLLDDEKEHLKRVKNARAPSPKKPSKERPSKPLKMCSAPPPTPSEPVVIPTRSATPKASRPAIRRTENPSDFHNPEAISPSMAALLAMTSIPRSKGLSIPRKGGRTSAPAKSLERLRIDDYRYSLSASSPKSWSILQSPPEESETDTWSLESGSVVAPQSSYRSLDSTPSLGFDFESPESLSRPRTPSVRSGRLSSRPKTLCHSRTEDCGLEHPLSPPLNEEPFESSTSPTPETSTTDSLPSPITRPKFSTSGRSAFKSNLTASINRLKSIPPTFIHAKSEAAPTLVCFSSLSAVPLSIPYADERRPVFTTDPSAPVPDASLRRYFNPNSPFSPSELHYHTTQRHSSFVSEMVTTSIQLQPYQRTPSTSKSPTGATSPPVFLPHARKLIEAELEAELKGGREVDKITLPKQREPRENSDFLRVVVLEMNMRRAGKMSEKHVGRARIWLPARAPGKVTCREDAGKRWIGEVA